MTVLASHELAVGFPPAEMERLASCLARLLPNLRTDDIALTGGVAIQVGMAQLGCGGSRETIADVDFVAGSLDAVRLDVVQSFLVSHYHAVVPGVPKFMVQLVDPATRIRVDIFPDLVGSLASSTAIRIGGHSIRMLSLEDIFEHKVLTISKASPTKPVDPKHADDMRALSTLLQRTMPAVRHDSLCRDAYGSDADLCCRRCELSSSARFPLAPKDRVFTVLGWMRQDEGDRLRCAS